MTLVQRLQLPWLHSVASEIHRDVDKTKLITASTGRNGDDDHSVSGLTGQWDTSGREGFHAAYLGIGKAYADIEAVDAKIAAMSREGNDLWACAAYPADRLVGFLVGKVSTE